MTQADLGPLDPQQTDGTELATLLTGWRDALHSLHKGATRPTYAVAGLLWIDDAAAPWTLKIFDGTDDIAVGTIDPATNTFIPAGVPDAGLIAGQLVLSGDISPTQLAADVNDYNPTNLATASVLRLSSDALRTITGLAGGSDGRILVVKNVGSQTIRLAAENAGSQAGNRFSFDLFLRAGHTAIVWYDAGVSRWSAMALYADVAQAGQYRSNAAGRVLVTDTVWGDAAPVAVSYAANVALDFSAGLSFDIGALTGPLTLDNPVNVKPGQSGLIRLPQDATGGRTLALGSNWFTAGGAVPTISSAANAVDYLSYFARSPTEILLTVAARGVA